MSAVEAEAAADAGVRDRISRPSKEQVRAWLLGRRKQCAELPSIEDLQRELRWGRFAQVPPDQAASDSGS